MFENNSENGRSMIKMLSAIAIIEILVLSALYGYLYILTRQNQLNNKPYNPNFGKEGIKVECRNNQDCNDGKEEGASFCLIDHFEITDDEDNYYQEVKGVCVPKGERPEGKIVQNIKTYNMGLLNWWSANNICKSYGLKLLDVEDLECYQSGTDTLIQTGSTGGYCCQKGKTCNATDWDINKDKFSPIIVELAKTYGNSYFPWTASQADSTGSNSRYAFYAYSNIGYVGHNSSKAAFEYALCH